MADYDKGLNRGLLGKRYEAAPVVVDPASIEAYARATSDENPRYLAGAGQVAPPMVAVRLTKEVLFAPLLDPELNCDLLMLLHGEQELRFHQLIRPGDRIVARSRIAEILDKETGQVLHLAIDLSREGQPVCDAVSTLFIRPRTPPEKKPGEGRRKAAPVEAPVWTLEDHVVVTADQPRRYAAASLDDNPIHLKDEVARAAGLRGAILQGLCTMAFCQRALVSGAAGGDPARLRSLKVRFAKPVYPGDQLTVQARILEDGALRRLAFRAVNQEGAEVITAGIGEVMA